MGDLLEKIRFHKTRVEKVDDLEYVAECTCGWGETVSFSKKTVGKSSDLYHMATQKANKHWEKEVYGGSPPSNRSGSR